MKKGISLPIEMIVIIAVAVLVLVVIMAFFLSQSNPTGITDSAAWATGCNTLRMQKNCVGSPADVAIINYKPSGSDIDQSLFVACQRLNYASVETCRVSCGCQAT